jgi:tetratricopeptide (TPR) repeat protein
MRVTRAFMSLLVVLMVLPAQAADGPPAASQRLARQMLRTSRIIIDTKPTEPVTIEVMDLAILLIREAIDLDPDDPEIWRFALALAELAEREPMRDEAVKRLAALDPADEVIRLRRLNMLIEQYNSVEERLEIYRKLLKRDELGNPVRSRLALAMAELLQRHGDMERYGDALARAVELDPANREAAAVAAGYFRTHLDDPVAEAEMLTNVMLADPTDITTQIALAQLLLESGAHRGAERIYNLAITNMRVLGHIPASGLLADQAIAQWANGHQQQALRTIQIRQNQIDEAVRRKAWEDNPDLSPLERARLHGPIDPTLATIRAVIFADQGGDSADLALRLVFDSYRYAIEVIKGRETPSPEAIARLQLRMAFVAVWLGNDLEQVQQLLDEAQAHRPLSDRARNRFNAWLALKRGEIGRAIELFESIDEPEPASLLGLGMAYLELGSRQDAARALLGAAREQPGSVIGIESANMLANLLGQRVALTDGAARMEQLIGSISPIFDRYPTTPTLALALRFEPAKPVVEPYEPFEMFIEIRNTTPYPMAIDAGGPIRPQALLQFETTSTRPIMEREFAPVVVDIGRRLSLGPRERLVVPVDIRRFKPGQVLDEHPLFGLFLKVNASVNFQIASNGTITSGLLGSDVWSSDMRIDGIPLSARWIEQTLSALESDSEPDPLPALALLGQVLAEFAPVAESVEGDAGEQIGQLMADAERAYIDGVRELDGVSLAWLLGVTPRENLLEEVRVLATESPDRLVQMSYLLYHLTGADDPMLDSAARSDDDVIRRLAKNYEDLFERVEKARRQEPGPVTPSEETPDEPKP